MIVVVQVVLGFPLVSKIWDRKREKRNKEIQRLRKENKEKIKSMNKHLTSEGEIERYIELNRFNLPAGEEWKPLLPEMIKDLLAIGWTADIPIYTKHSYGAYSIWIDTSDKELRSKALSVFHKYDDLAMGLEGDE